MVNSTSSTTGSDINTSSQGNVNPSEYTLQLYSQLTGPESVARAKIRIGLVKSILESKGISYRLPDYGDIHYYWAVIPTLNGRDFSISCGPRGGIYATYFAEIMHSECHDFVTVDDFRDNIVSVMDTLT